MRRPFAAPLLALVLEAAAASCTDPVNPGSIASSDEDPVEDAGSAPTHDDASTEKDARALAPDAGDAAFDPPVACGAVLPGPTLPSNLPEAQPGYASELAALDLSKAPDPVDYAGENALARARINFMLGRSSGTSVSHAVALAQPMGRAILGAAVKGGDAGIDNTFLRRGLHYFYPCSRPVPKDLDALRSRYGDFTAWPARTIACAKPKNGPRRLFENAPLGIYVAETLSDGGVRETEVLFTKLRDDGQIDFAAYTAAGELSDRSTFATGGGETTSAAPFTCMACHFESGTGKLSIPFPSGTGAGCKN